MLKLSYLFENYELAKECLNYYQHSENYLDKMLSYFRISSNAIYPFYANDEWKVCFLRLSPVEEKNIDEVKSEINFINRLRVLGYNAMKPYPMKNGKLCDQIKTQWGTYNVSCFEKVEGDTLDDMDGDDKLIFGYGKMLGLLHNLSQGYPYSDERKDHNAMMEKAKERLICYHAPKAVCDFCDETRRKLNELLIDESNYGLIHYDFEPDNVLYDEERDAFGVIDFDDAIRCFYALDVVRAIDSLNDIVKEEDLAHAAEVFIEGYRSVRQFTDEQMASLNLMRDAVKCEEYGTILHVLSDSVEKEPDWMLEIKDELNTRLQQLIETMN